MPSETAIEILDVRPVPPRLGDESSFSRLVAGTLDGGDWRVTFTRP